MESSSQFTVNSLQSISVAGSLKLYACILTRYRVVQFTQGLGSNFKSPNIQIVAVSKKIFLAAFVS